MRLSCPEVCPRRKKKTTANIAITPRPPAQRILRRTRDPRSTTAAAEEGIPLFPLFEVLFPAKASDLSPVRDGVLVWVATVIVAELGAFVIGEAGGAGADEEDSTCWEFAMSGLGAETRLVEAGLGSPALGEGSTVDGLGSDPENTSAVTGGADLLGAAVTVAVAVGAVGALEDVC